MESYRGTIETIAVQFLACPHCGVRASEPCVTRGGRETGHTHLHRINLSQKLWTWVYQIGYDDGYEEGRETGYEVGLAWAESGGKVVAV